MEYEVNLQKANIPAFAFDILGDSNVYGDKLKFNHLNETNCRMEIDGEKVPFTKKLKTEGNHKVKIFIKDPSKIPSLEAMFAYCVSLKKADLSHSKLSGFNSTKYMFNECRALTSFNIKGLDTKNVTDMHGMFNECQSIEEADLEGLSSDKVENMTHMFCECVKLKKANVKGMKVGNVKEAECMFYKCNPLKELIFSDGFTFNKDAKINHLFDECYQLDNKIKKKIAPWG